MTATEAAPADSDGYVLDRTLVWPSFGYQPHAGQRTIHRSSARHRLASCGRRFGKSKLGGAELVPEALYAHTIAHVLAELQEQRRFWIVGPNYDDAEREWRVFYDAMKRLKVPMDRPGTYNDVTGGNMQMSLWDGRFIVECRSAQHQESLDGEGLNGVLMVEAAKMKSIIWNKFIRPALADKRGWSLHTSTPEGKNHYYDLWRRGQDPSDPSWASWRMPSWKNDIIFPGGREDPEIQEMAKDMSEERFNQEIKADFTDFVGRVFKTFESETHVIDTHYDPRYPVFLALDYGWTNPFVALLIQVDVWDNVYVLDEYRCTEQDSNDIGESLLTWHGGLATKVKAMFPDPADPDATSIISKKLGIQSRVNKNTGGEKKYRIEAIRNHLKLIPETAPEEDRLPRLFIDRKCTGLIFEMEEWRYPDKKSEVHAAPEEPMDKDDHGPEALGRFFKGHYGLPGSAKRQGVRQSTANMGGSSPRGRRRAA